MFERPFDSTTSASLARRGERANLSTVTYQVVVRYDEKRKRKSVKQRDLKTR
jgi:hypothetical protein